MMVTFQFFIVWFLIDLHCFDQLDVAKSIGASAAADLELLKTQIENFDKFRINKDTSVGDMRIRFPEMAKEAESEIKNHQWGSNI